MVKYPKNSKTDRDLQKSLFIHKMFAVSKNDHAFQKMFVKSKKVREFQKLFHKFPKKSSSILEMCADSRKLFKNSSFYEMIKKL